jgi:phospholipase/lecithinase/hemolysin
VKNNLHSILVVLVAVLLSVSGSAAAMFTDMVVIGDSLSDQGNVFLLFRGFIPPAEYTDGTNFGRFTNGLNYIDYLSSALNLTVTPALAGGSNYATGGARTDSASLGGVSIGPFSLLDQRDSYVNGLGPSGANPEALHVVWGGSNDLTDIIETVIANPGFDPVPGIENAVNNIAGVVGSLAAANARTILIPNVPNLGIIPLITGGGPPVAEATALSGLFNTDLAAAMDNLSTVFPNTKLIEFDTFNLFTNVFQDPAAFGFTNVADACYSELGVPGGTTCANPGEFLSWDGFHPTTAAHQLLAANMTVPVPAAVWLFGSGLMGLVGIANRKKVA